MRINVIKHERSLGFFLHLKCFCFFKNRPYFDLHGLLSIRGRISILSLKLYMSYLQSSVVVLDVFWFLSVLIPDVIGVLHGLTDTYLSIKCQF